MAGAGAATAAAAAAAVMATCWGETRDESENWGSTYITLRLFGTK